MTKLSVNINKIAVVRNSRGGNLPDVVRAALDCERFGAQGITVHPRPDARHIRYSDVRDLKKVLTTEFNIEGNPIPSFRELVLEVRPAQVTLVPDAENAITSNAGWNTVKYRDFLREVTAEFQARGIRVSIFVDPVAEMVAGAKECGADPGWSCTPRPMPGISPPGANGRSSLMSGQLRRLAVAVWGSMRATTSIWRICAISSSGFPGRTRFRSGTR